MKKAILSVVCCASILSANSAVSVLSGKKDYNNSKTKVDGKVSGVKFSNNHKIGLLSLGYTKDKVDRQHPIKHIPIETLEVRKYNLYYKYNINKKANIKASYIRILDNLAPTDQGNVYGIGGLYKLPKGFGAKVDIYKSDYKEFDVSEYDVGFFKVCKLDKIKTKLSITAKSINIDGQKYAKYNFEDKSYLTTNIKLGASYNGFSAGVGTFIGKRAFTVLDDGQKVQHHAMEQDRTYMLSLGKKFKHFDVMAKYSFQNGKELPENQDDVDAKVVSLAVSYKF
jgi:hypothetical protein